MTGLVRLPLQIVRTGARLGVGIGRFALQRVRGDDEHDGHSSSAPSAPPPAPPRREPERREPESREREPERPEPARREPVRREREPERREPERGTPAGAPPVSPDAAADAALAGGRAQASATQEQAPAASPDLEAVPELAPRHVEVPVEEVASFGPPSDAGPQIVVEAPWSNYDRMSAQDVIDRLRAADEATKAAVLLYERRHKNRKTVAAAALA